MSERAESQHDRDVEFAAALDDLLSAWAEHRPMAPRHLLERYPGLADQLDELLELAREIAVVRPPVRPDVPGYEILDEAGRGGMGIVYRARQRDLDRQVALKVATGAVDVEALRHRFLAEARALGRLRHPGVVTIHEVIDLPDVCAYAMEWISGGSLLDRIEQRVAGGADSRQPMVFVDRQEQRFEVDPVTWTCRLGVVLGRALAEMHRSGLLHRDVKPGNVLLQPDGTPRLSDFGLVHDGSGGLTRTGQVLGTLCYASPEQLRGETTLGPTTDVYGLGATLWCTLSGTPPYPGRTPTELLAAIEAGRLRRPPPKGVPEDVQTILAKCLQFEVRDRYATGDDVADELQRVLDLRPILARPIGPAERVWRLLRRNRALLVAASLAAAAVVVAGALLVWWLYAGWTLPQRREAALTRARQQLLHPAHSELAIFVTRGQGAPGEVIQGSEVAPGAADLEEARSCYAAALAIDPADEPCRLECEVLAAASALLAGTALPPLPLLRRLAPRTAESVDAWAAQPDAQPATAVEAIDCRALGLLAYITRRASACHVAWQGLDLAGDPFVDAASAQLHVARGDFEKAWPRFARASQAWPDAGFLSIGMARCALAAGDLRVAQDYIALAERQEHQDPFHTWRAVRGAVLAAGGRWQAARADYDWMLDHHYGVEVRISYARQLEALGDFGLACDLLLHLAEREPVEERSRWLSRVVALWVRGHEAGDAAGRAAGIEREWAQGLGGRASRIRRLIAQADALQWQAVLESLTAGRTFAPVGGVLPHGGALAAMRWIEVTAPWVDGLPPRWRRGLAAAIVGWTSEPGLRAVAARPWLLPVADGIARSWSMVADAVFRAACRHPTVAIEWRAATGENAPLRRNPLGCADADARRLVVHGGVPEPPNGSFAGDTWACEGHSWQQLAVASGPGPRGYGAMAHDGVGWLLCGGCRHGRELADPSLWRLEPGRDGLAWRTLDGLAEAPGARMHPVMAFDRHREVVVLFGGCGADGTPYNDTWEWSARDMRWQLRQAVDRHSGTQPVQTTGAAFVYDGARRVCWLFGGLERKPGQLAWRAGMWSWNGHDWRQVPDDVELPPNRTWATFVEDGSRGTCLLHGGLSPCTQLRKGTWEWDGAGWSLLDEVAAAPAIEARCVSSVGMCRDGELTLVGGGDGRGIALGVRVGRIVPR